MYCQNCGKDIGGEASFCPYCGAKTAVTLPETKRKTENFIQTAYIKNEKNALPVYKHNGKKRIKFFLIGFILLIDAIIRLIPLNEIYPKEIKTEQTSEESVIEEPFKPAETTAATVVNANWQESTKSHGNLGVNSTIEFGDGIIWNFGKCTAVGKGIKGNAVTETEADYGFVIRVKDDDTVIVDPYDNSGTGIVPIGVTAELASGNYVGAGTMDMHEITGYKDCPDGLGIIDVMFPDDVMLTAGIFKENGRLYAVNVEEKPLHATSIVDCRLKFEGFMQKAGITEKDALYTDPIYYPIVPVGIGETTDTAHWVKESSKIVKKDWTDAHKVMALYNYVIDNFAYDHWVLKQGDGDIHSRAFYHNDFSGKYYISKTRIGVCEDFSQVLAIMCRAQGIPALEVHSEDHAMTATYIKDYDRWLLIDTTADLMHDVYEEDVTAWVEDHATRYKHLNSVTDKVFTGIGIGNYEDMKSHGIPTYD